MQSKPRTPHRARWRLLASLAIPVLASCGGGSSDTPAPPPPPATALSLLAGSTDGPGNQDGTGAFAKISVETGGMALTPAGDVLMADTGNNTIRKLSPTGQLTTVAGSRMIDDAKIGGITPAMFSLSGRCDDWPPYTLLPT